MQEKNLWRQLGKTVLFGTIIGVSGLYFAGLLLIIFPAFFMISSVRDKLLPAMGAMAISSFLVGIFTDIQIGIFLFMCFSPMVLIFHYCVVSEKDYRFTIILMAFVLLLSFLAIDLGQTNAMEDFNYKEQIETMIDQQIKSLSEGLTSLEISRLDETLREAYKFTFMILPAILIIGSIFISYYNYIIAGRSLFKEGILIKHPPIFSALKLNRFILVPMIVSLFAVLYLKYTNSEIYEAVSMNVILIFGFFLAINGMATISFYLEKLKVPRFLRGLSYILIVFIKPLLIAAAFVGLSDLIFDFRKIGVA